MPLFGEKRYKRQEKSDIQDVLRKEPSGNCVSVKKGPGTQKEFVIEYSKLIASANEIFGFNGWSHSVTQQTIDYVDFDNEKYDVGVSALVKVMLKDGSFHEDVGYGICKGLKCKGAAIAKARKAAAADGLTNTIRLFGNGLGNVCPPEKITQYFSPSQQNGSIQRSQTMRRPQSNSIKRVKRKLAPEFENKINKKYFTKNNNLEKEIERPTETVSSLLHPSTSFAVNNCNNSLASASKSEYRDKSHSHGPVTPTSAIGMNSIPSTSLNHNPQIFNSPFVGNTGQPVIASPSKTYKETSSFNSTTKIKLEPVDDVIDISAPTKYSSNSPSKNILSTVPPSEDEVTRTQRKLKQLEKEIEFRKKEKIKLESVLQTNGGKSYPEYSPKNTSLLHTETNLLQKPPSNINNHAALNRKTIVELIEDESNVEQ